jgi:two-component system copper resistance phosphate regulon response regulator CusR
MRGLGFLTKRSGNLQKVFRSVRAVCDYNGRDDVRILVVEDEQKLAKALREGLEADHYSVTVVHTGEEGFYLARAERFDVVILDVMLPGRDGFEILATLRQSGAAMPVLLLTARDAISDRVHGLDAGADDYLVKPFAFPELLARIRALVRRGATDSTAGLKIADLEMDLAGRSATRSGKELDLTPREFDLLEYLLIHQGRVVSREMLARDLWKEVRHTPLDNVIDVHVARLRRKVDDRFEKKLVHTVRGVGFVVREDAR